uniref:Small ribosomal subunit protein uS7 domain-containing protein n=1 Tax=Salix viminalis TaxID=40686 RepID=A0A6N2KG53_SALVM
MLFKLPISFPTSMCQSMRYAGKRAVRDPEFMREVSLLNEAASNCSEILSYMGSLDGEQKQLIKKLVNFRMKEGKRTRVRAIVYQTFHRPARTERDVIKLMVDAIENIKPICEVEKVGVAVLFMMSLIARDRQQTLAIRWILEAAFKRRISYRISLEKCSFAEILDAYRKRGIARKKRRIFMDWLPPIEVSRISDGTTFSYSPSFIELRNPYHRARRYALHERPSLYDFSFLSRMRDHQKRAMNECFHLDSGS